MSPIPHPILLHLVGGFVVAAVFVSALVLTEAGMVLRGAPPGPLLLLWVFCGMTFGLSLGASALPTLTGARESHPRR